MTSSRKRHRRRPEAVSTISASDTDTDRDTENANDSTALTTQDLDDSVFFRRRETRHHPRYKDSQLCAQVADLLGAALASVDDLDVARLLVVSVVPAPDTTRLLVTVCSPSGSPPIADDLTARLGRLKGHLRAEVAWGITRKRAPDLAFVVGAAEEAWR